MGSGCACQNSTENDASDRIRLHRQGNLTFYIHERLVSGKGCKKTPAWQTTMTKEEIDIKIKEFWDTRVEGNPMVWQVLQQACAEPEPEKAEDLVKAYNLTLNNGLLQQTYDERGYRYDLPPFVINLAVKYGETKIIARAPVQVKAENIELILRAAGLTDYKVNTKTNETVKNIKGKFLVHAKLQKDVRLFFNGRELKDDSLLGHCNVPNGVVIQVFIKP
ncbi:hypothetical protein SteCoe_31031 [Stentor coeruleus]|uniref:Ubiquitin-like domain-containing protein n=1 Tax=Stentor coeruleus TaxID=5963 RepID=A0A1R2B286_9CILI|nr:hypothetical protein SteCoe_31031 [Stentor coeruleus]